MEGSSQDAAVRDQQAWAAWWTDQQGYVYKPPQAEPKPTFVQNVPLAFVP